MPWIIFGSLGEAPVVINQRRLYYNAEQLHSSLGYQTPFKSAGCDNGRPGSAPSVTNGRSQHEAKGGIIRMKNPAFGGSPWKIHFCLPALLILAWMFLLSAKGQERLRIDAQINGKPVKLFFETGASHSVLFRNSAQQLGLQYTMPDANIPPASGRVSTGVTEECQLTVGKVTIPFHFAVFENPAYVRASFDGALAWEDIRNNILEIDALHGLVNVVAPVTGEASEWHTFSVSRKSSCLELEMVRVATTNIIVVDTGDFQGIGLPPERWAAWKRDHPGQPVTLNAGFMPGAGLRISEESWAKEIILGPLRITDVPVTEAARPQMEVAGSAFEGVLGLAALKRLNLIVDGKRNLAYLQTRNDPPSAYPHNRLGAVFVPKDASSDDLVAHVIADSPAFQAGIRSGDILLKIDAVDATQWRQNPTVLPLSRFWERPAGTVLHLMLRRGQDTVETSAKLENILGSDVTAATKNKKTLD